MVAGGAGCIGSHTVVELQKAGHNPIIVDNRYNAKADVVDRIQRITGVRPAFYEADCVDKAAVEQVFAENQIDTVIQLRCLQGRG